MSSVLTSAERGPIRFRSLSFQSFCVKPHGPYYHLKTSFTLILYMLPADKFINLCISFFIVPFKFLAFSRREFSGLMTLRRRPEWS